MIPAAKEAAIRRNAESACAGFDPLTVLAVVSALMTLYKTLQDCGWLAPESFAETRDPGVMGWYLMRRDIRHTMFNHPELRADAFARAMKTLKEVPPDEMAGFLAP